MATERPTDDRAPVAAGQAALFDEPGLLQGVVRRWLQELLESEMADYLGAARYERVGSRRGYRSGHRPRRLQSRLGELELLVPTERSGRYRTRLFERYQRSEQAFLLTLQEMYLQGVSTRRVRQITEQLCGIEVSASSVSRATRRVDTHGQARGTNQNTSFALPESWRPCHRTYLSIFSSSTPTVETK